MKHQTGMTGWPSGNIFDFRARLPEVCCRYYNNYYNYYNNSYSNCKQAGIFKTRNLNCLLQIYCPFAKLPTAHFSE